MKFSAQSIEGVGIGLRAEHYQTILEEKPKVPWFEAITENYIGERALPDRHLSLVRRDYPIVFHGVSLSIGSTDPLNLAYIAQLKALQKKFEPSWISDHLCWTSFNQNYLPDLLPLPFNENAISHLVDRIQQVQELLGQRILLENISSYLRFKQAEMPEWCFITEVVQRADCYILLDINNIYVNAKNHGFDAIEYLKGIPINRVKQFHLAGHENQQTHLLDTHSRLISEPVWDLYQQALTRFGAEPALIEWDSDIPDFDTLLAQAHRAERHQQKIRQQTGHQQAEHYGS